MEAGSVTESYIDSHTWTNGHAADLNKTNLGSVLQGLDSNGGVSLAAGECEYSEGPQVADVCLRTWR
jgi:hypothetical protein